MDRDFFSRKNGIAALAIVFAGMLLWLLYAANGGMVAKDREPNGIDRQTPGLTGKANITWNQNVEPDTKGYRIYYGTERRTGDCPQGGYAHTVDVGNVTSHELKDLQVGLTYYFSITAYDAGGRESCFSSEVSKTIAASPASQ